MDTTPLDLAAYARRIGHDGGVGAWRPNRATLQALIERHATAIPFENLDALSRRPPSLDLGTLQDKLLHRARGGWCFEQNTLLLAVLREIGFDARPREARMRANVPPAQPTARTHMALEVRLDGEALLVDVGCGGLAPLGPVPLRASPTRCADGAEYRVLADDAGEQLLQIRGSAGWDDAYRLLPGRPLAVDFEVANWFVGTHPQALLGNHVLVSRAVDGGRLTLFDHELSFRRAATGTFERRTLQGADEIGDTLRGRFGLDLDDPTLDVAMQVLARLPRPQ